MKHFSEREEKIIKILGKKSLTIKEISHKLFDTNAPLNAEILVANNVRTIIKKCKFYKLSWCLYKDNSKSRLIIFRLDF